MWQEDADSGPDQRVDPFAHLPNKHCFARRLPSATKPTKHESLEIAQSECRDVPKCGGVYKPLGDGAYFLCDKLPTEESKEGGQVWGKPRGMATVKITSVGKRAPGQAQPGVWCSNWCCCAPGWHGEACDDADECLSRPCLNNGVCSESSSTYLVNDYFRKYRCECAQGLDGKPHFRGHNCADAVTAGGTTCKMDEFGAKSANASTSTLYAYKQFQVALEFTGITLKSSDANFNERGGVCGQQFVLYNNVGIAIATPVVNCCTKGKKCTSVATGRPEIYAVMSLCSTPCMMDPASKCCLVPAEVSWMYPCCRALGCCPDQHGKGTSGVSAHKKRRALGQLVAPSVSPPPHELPAVSISVSVEESSSSMATYKSTMQCLRSPTPTCLRAHKLSNVGQHTDAALGRRLFDSPKPPPPPPPPTPNLTPSSLRTGTATTVPTRSCQNNGVAVTCDDGVHNGNEAMADCGGICTRNQAKQCTTAAMKAVDSLTALGPARPGKYEVLLQRHVMGRAQRVARACAPKACHHMPGVGSHRGIRYV